MNENTYPFLLQNINLIKASLEILDNTCMDQSLDAIFHELLHDDFSLENFEMTCIELLSMLHEFRKIRSLGAIRGLYEGIANPSKFTYNILDTLCDWFSKEFNESITHVKNYYQLQYSKKIRKIVLCIHEQYAQDLSLTKLAALIDVSPTYLSTIFKDETGKTVSEYLLIHRLKEAKRLLSSTNMKIYEVAENVGFHSSQYFAKLFHRMNGLTPLQYRDAKKSTHYITGTRLPHPPVQ